MPTRTATGTCSTSQARPRARSPRGRALPHARCALLCGPLGGPARCAACPGLPRAAPRRSAPSPVPRTAGGPASCASGRPIVPGTLPRARPCLPPGSWPAAPELPSRLFQAAGAVRGLSPPGRHDPSSLPGQLPACPVACAAGPGPSPRVRSPGQLARATVARGRARVPGEGTRALMRSLGSCSASSIPWRTCWRCCPGSLPRSRCGQCWGWSGRASSSRRPRMRARNPRGPRS